MTLHNPSPGAGNVSEYMVSGLPWVTASNAASGTITQINFPYVTSFLTIKNAGGGANLKVGFTNAGVSDSNYFTLTPSGSFSADLRVKSLFITATSGTVNYELVAGLTLIQPRNFPVLTGSTSLSVTASVQPVFGYQGI